MIGLEPDIEWTLSGHRRVTGRAFDVDLSDCHNK